MKPRARPENMKKKKKKPMTSSLRPKLRPESDGGAVARGNRAAMREATDAATLTMPEGQNMKAGGMAKKGYAAGGKTKGAAKGGKVRGAGIARKGVRPAKMI